MIELNAARFSANAVKKCAVVFAAKNGRLASEAGVVDKELGKAISRAIKESRFIGSDGDVLRVSGVDNRRCGQALVIGAGGRARYERSAWVLRGVDAGKAVDATGCSEASVVFTGEMGKADVVEAITAFAEGFRLAVYRFEQFKTKQKEHQKSKLEKLNFLVDGKALKAVKEALPKVDALMSGNELTRELVNLPPNIAKPTYMAEVAKEMKELGLEVEVLGKKELEKLGMNLMLAVGRGSKDDSQLIMIRHKGGKKGEPFHAIVGKGVMFDTGGYNLKPTGYMETMKCDMAGAGAVFGTMKALALRGVKKNVLGVCPCVMNMVDADAFLPSEILTSYKGDTVEIGNTDAEGRLALADAISYTIDKEKPVEIIDLATLTGACMVALGSAYAGLFSNNARLANRLKAAGAKVGERLWQMPVDDIYASKPSLADLSNDGNRYGGASSAAVFLKNFADKTNWAHLDIAGVAIEEKIPSIMKLSGASGFGVRLLVEYFEGLAAEESAAAPKGKGKRK